MNYNLIRNGSLKALTTAGTGDISLSYDQLEKLQDQNTTSNSVTITSGVLYLEADLSQRIKVDGIRLYADDLTKSSNIEFAFKNSSGGSYTPLSTSVSSHYSTTIPDPSAPRFVRAVISGTNIGLFEFQIFNDDTIVAFGQDGQTFAEYLTDTPIGTVGTPQAVAIYNNGTSPIPAVAYVSIDHTATSGDNYVEISTSLNGTYFSIDDGALIEDDKENSTYRWGMGLFDDVEVSADKLVVPVTNAIDYRLGEIPLTDKTNSFNTADHCWDYDKINEKMYVIASDGIVKLFDYDYNNDVWTHINEINPGCTGHSTKASMCYMNDYVYVICDGDQDFGRYDLNGPTASGGAFNWTSLSSPTADDGGTDSRRNICSDYIRYIYSIDLSTTPTNKLQRYDTVSGTWSALSSGYSLVAEAHESPRCHMWFDGDEGRSFLYLIIGWRTETRYIQRYSIDLDTWNTTYFDLNTIYAQTSFADNQTSMSYYDNIIWFMLGNAAADNKLYKYNVSTTVFTEIDIGFKVRDGLSATLSDYMIAIKPKPDKTGRLFMGNIDSNRSYLFTYDEVPDAGTYTTPIFQLTDGNQASYFVIDGNTTSGVASISFDGDVFDGTIRVRNSDTAPIVVEEVYWNYHGGTDTTDGAVQKSIVHNDVTTDIWANVSLNATWAILGATAVDRRTGYVAAGFMHSTVGQINVYDRDGNLVYAPVQSTRYRADVNMEFDKFGGLWIYGDFFKYLVHFDSVGIIYELYNSGTDFVYDLAAEMDGDGVWYTDKIDDILYHLDGDGTILHTISLDTPRAICGTLDNGCWVSDNNNQIARRYNSSGVLVTSVTIGRSISRMTTDMNNGFWYLSGNRVYHVTSGGTQDVNVEFNQPTKIKGGHNGVLVWSENQDYVKYLNNAGSVTRTFTAAAIELGISGYPALFSFRLEDAKDFKDTSDIMPVSYDPIWGTGGSLSWLEVRKDGYFLPKKIYHQAEITLRGSAELTKVIMAPALKVQDIPAGDFKNIYIRTNIPEVAGVDDYTARIKAWWGVS